MKKRVILYYIWFAIIVGLTISSLFFFDFNNVDFTVGGNVESPAFIIPLCGIILTIYCYNKIKRKL